MINTCFWSRLDDLLKASEPNLKVLRIVNGDIKPSMTFLHEAFLEAKKPIKWNFDELEASYCQIIENMDKRWAKQYKFPLVKDAFFLNLGFYHKMKSDPKTRDDCAEFEITFSDCIDRMIQDDLERKMKVLSNMCLYKERDVRFGASTTSTMAETTHPLEWWEIFDMESVEMRKLTTRILSLCSSASSYERNWSTFYRSEIFMALEKVKLVVGKRETLNYSRCGRTDRGVSSTGQVISLYVRSRCNDNCSSEEKCEKEIDYVKVLNRALPRDIRVMGWCSVAPNFHSRFSCLGREYKYFFWKGTFDIEAMRAAGLKLIGEYDFRNFCKMDAANVSNYKRKITLFDISICNKRDMGMSSDDEDQLYAMTIKGTAFLWHQVRCMVSLLFFIGQGLESPTIIDLLLDTSKIPRKPQYTMASDVPLVLRSCEFEDINFFCSSVARRALVDDLNDMVKSLHLQAAIFNEALALLHIPGDYQDEHKNKKICHVPLLSRPTEPSYEERLTKLILKKKAKKIIETKVANPKS